MCETNENAKLFIVLELLHIACICMFNILSRTKSYQFQIKLPVIFPSMGGEARGGDIPYALSANRWPFSSVEIYSGVDVLFKEGQPQRAVSNMVKKGLAEVAA